MGGRRRLQVRLPVDLGAAVTDAPVVEGVGVTKTFGTTRALDAVNLRVAPGEIHALIGLNGSGKSTMVKILAGVYAPDAGSIRHGRIAVVHQDLGLLPSLTVLENFVIGRPVTMRRGMIDWKAEGARARSALAAFEMDVPLGMTIQSLTPAERVTVAVARAVDRAGDDAVSAILLDEPTSALPAHETELLAGAMRGFARAGLGVLIVTHRLQEVLDLADSVTVLRNGTATYTGTVAGMSQEQLAHLMLGSVPMAPDGRRGRRAGGQATGEHVLRATGVTHGSLREVDISVDSGAVLGLFGVHGSGAQELATLYSGREWPERGTVEIDGVPVATLFAQGRGVGYIPSDRPQRGILPTLSVSENISLTGLSGLTRWGAISARRETDLGRRWMEELGIKAASPRAPISSLSGGNQQKAMVARWLEIDPVILVADEPTQGVDVWAKQDILRTVRDAATRGTVVVLCAGEPEEILEFCDRVVVMNAGRVALDCPRSETSTADILGAMH